MTFSALTADARGVLILGVVGSLFDPSLDFLLFILALAAPGAGSYILYRCTELSDVTTP